MKITLIFCSIMIYSLASFAQQKNESKDKILFKSDDYSIYDNRVEQGNYKAVANSTTEITSNYQSPKNLFQSPLIDIKFSINCKDNDLPFGEKRSILITPDSLNRYQTNILKFGQQDSLQVASVADTAQMAKNVKVTFRLDMRNVFADFATKGFYETINGDIIAKDEFKGVYIAGNSSPLSWDFENLNVKGFEMKDENQDSIYTFEAVLNPDVPEHKTSPKWTLSQDISKYPQQKTNSVLLDALYNLSLEEVVLNKEDSTFRTGKEWAGVWTRDISYSIVLGLGAIEPERSMAALRRKVDEKKRIIQDTGTGGSWPVSSDRTVWAMAAWELYCVTGDRAWLKESYEILSNTLKTDMKVLMSPDGLAMGESSFIDWRKQSYPFWMNNVDIARSECIGTNAVHFAAYKIAALMSALLNKDKETAQFEVFAQNLQKAVKTNLWIPSKGYFGQYRYGRTAMLLSENPEVLGESLAVLYGLAPVEDQAKVIENTPILNWGSPVFYPQLPNIDPYHNNGIWPFVQGFWCFAAAKTQNGLALEHGMASIYRADALFLTNKENFVAQNGDFNTILNSDRQLWSIAATLGLSYKVLFGLSYQDSSLVFRPSIPKAYAGTRTLTNLKYRNAVLDIEINGYGNKIKRFKLDGKKQKQPMVIGNITGKHTIEIEMENNDFSAGQKINLVQNKVMLETPNAKIDEEEDNRLYWNEVKGASSYEIYSNGQFLTTLEGTSFGFAESKKFREITVRAKATDGSVSYFSEPVSAVSDKNIRFIEAETLANITDHKLVEYTGKGAIKVSNTENTSLKLNIDAPESADYLLSVRYSNGSGAYNNNNKCATRTVFVNKKNRGVLLMPQRGDGEWSNWGESNYVPVRLFKGQNTIQIDLLPDNTNMNIAENTAIIDNIKLIKK